MLELSPSLHLLQYFAPSEWARNNATDLDLSTAPALLADGQVVAAGKSGVAYLLDGARLGGIGGQEDALPGACPDDIDGGVAVVGSTVYLPCLSGTIAVRASASPQALRLLWRAPVGGGPPIVADGLVWTIGQDGVLYGLDPSTGSVRQHATVGVPANHFPTPSVGAGLLAGAGANRVVAFSAPAATPPSSHHVHHGGPPDDHGAGQHDDGTGTRTRTRRELGRLGHRTRDRRCSRRRGRR